MIEALQEIQTIQIGTEFYRLVEIQGEHPRLAWEETFTDEESWRGGTPDILFDPTDTWHMGGFKTREGIPGTTDEGQNTDCRWPGRIVPGPKTYQFTLTSSADLPTLMFEALGQLFVGCGQRLYRISTGDVVTLSKNFGTDYSIRDGVRWDSDQAIVTTVHPSAGDELWRLTALGTPDSWTKGTATGTRLAVGVDRLFKVNAAGVLKNCLSGKDPTSEGNWADEVQCGDTDIPPSRVVAYERTAIVGKTDGLFGVSEEGKGVPLLTRLPPNTIDALGMKVIEPWVFVPHKGGCLRYQPGFVEAMGIEKEILNENPNLRGQLRSFDTDGPWIFGLYTYLDPGGTKAQLCVAREAKQGETSLGPYIWDTLTYIDNASVRIHVSHLWTPPRLFYGYNVNLKYIRLAGDYGTPDPEGDGYRFLSSGWRRTYNYTFGTWRKKNFPKVELAVRNASTLQYWTLRYRVDRGTWITLDREGNTMDAKTDGLHTFEFGKNARGFEIQYDFTYTGNVDSDFAEIVHFKPYAVPFSPKLRHYTLHLLLGGELRHDGGIEQRTSLDQLNDLQALTQDAESVAFKGPWGDIEGLPSRMRVLETRQEGHELPRFLVEYVVQKRAT